MLCCVYLRRVLFYLRIMYVWDSIEKLILTVGCCVQFVCQEGHGDFVLSIDERETCSYIVTVHTSRICTHPLFGPPVTIKSLPISCNPLLSASDYEIYMKGMCFVVFASMHVLQCLIPWVFLLFGLVFRCHQRLRPNGSTLVSVRC